MEFQEAHKRLRRAAEFIAEREKQSDPTNVLQGAWEFLDGLRGDDFPAQFSSTFNYIQHEMSRLENGEVTLREAIFLLKKIRDLELKWID